MTVVYAENFMIFKDASDFKRLAPSAGWRVGNTVSGTFRRAANLGPFNVRPSATLGDSATLTPAMSAAYRDTSGAPGDRCLHMRFRAESTFRAALAKIGFTDESIMNMQAISTNYNAIDIEIMPNAMSSSSPAPVRVYHRVPTNSLGSAVNSLLIGEIAPVYLGMSYTIEARLHLAGADSRIDITWNGTPYSFPFNPARLATAWQASAFDHIALQTATVGFFSDMVVYRDDASTPYPLGGVNVDIIEPVDAKLRVSELNDDTVVTLANDQMTAIPMTAASVTNEIIDMRVVARVAAGTGDQPIRAEILATRGGDVHTVLDAPIPVGGPVQLVHHKLPEGFMVDPNEVVISAAGKPGV